MKNAVKFNYERTTIQLFLAKTLPGFTKNRLYSLFFLALLLAGYPEKTEAQHNLLLYNMDQVPQSNLLNPGKIPLVNGFVGLPVLSGVRLGAGNTGFTYRQFDMARMKDSYDFDYAGLRDHLRSGNNRFVADNEFRLLSLGLRRGKGYFSFDIGDAAYVSGNYSPDLLNMFDDIQQNRLGYENEGSMEERLYDQSWHNATGAYYRSYSLGYAREFCSDLTVGGRVRYLQGVAGLWSQNNGLMFRYPGYGDYFDVQGQLALQSSGLNTSDNDGLLSTLFPGGNNKGFAFDLGATYRVNDRLKVSASAANLGRIKWKSNVNYQMVDNSQQFSAVDIQEHTDTWNAVGDSLANGQPMYGGTYFMTPLPKRFYLGGNYQLCSSTRVGVLVNAVRFEGVTDMAVSVSGNTQLNKVWGLSAGVGYNRYSPFNLGFGASANLGKVQFYAVADNVINTFNWKNGRAVQAQVGINLAFGALAESDTLPVFNFMAETSDTSNIVSATEDSRKPLLGLFKRRSNAPAEQAPEVVPETTMPLATPTPTAEVNSTGTPTWSATARDLETGQALKGVQLELYKVTDNGEQELSLIKSFLDGRLSVVLDPGYAYQIVVNKPGYEPTDIFIQKNKLMDAGSAPARDVLLRKPEPVAPSRPRTTPTAPPIKSTVPKNTTPASDMNQTTPPAKKQPISTAEENTQNTSPSETYQLMGPTSLRVGPSHTTGVVLRFKAGDTVEVLEKTNQWWWKIRFGEQTGYVKAQALVR